MQAGGRHVMLVAEIRTPAVWGTERVDGGHIMTVAVMVAPTVGRTGGCKLVRARTAGGGDESTCCRRD